MIPRKIRNHCYQAKDGANGMAGKQAGFQTQLSVLCESKQDSIVNIITVTARYTEVLMVLGVGDKED